MKVFIGNYTGICNHLETVILAFAVRERFGHEIWLDWPELDAFAIDSTHVGAKKFYHRFNGVKYPGNDEAAFETLGRYRHVDLRGLYGAPPALLDPQLPHVTRSLRLNRGLAAQIKDFFAGIQRPVVGVHIRRGDFLVDPERKRRHAATSDMQLSFALERISRRFPDTVFFLSYTGKVTDYNFLLDRFNCVTLPIPTPYSHHGAPQASETHPIADLFALACCPSIVVTPRSSFSHWAANCLGSPSISLVPGPLESSAEIGLSIKRFGACRLPAFMNEPWKATDVRDLDLPAPQKAQTDWL